MASSYTTNKALEKPGYNDYINSWNVPTNSDWDVVDACFAGTLSVSLTNSDVTLTQTNCQNMRVRLTGVLSANVNIFFPSGVAGFFVVTNATTNAYTVTLASVGGGTSVTSVQTQSAIIFTDGTNVIFADDTRASLTAGAGITITPGTSPTISITAPVTAILGGTGYTSYAVGDLLYASTTTALSKLADVAVGSVLASGGVNTAPSWSSAPTLSGVVSTTTFTVKTNTSVLALTVDASQNVTTTAAISDSIGNVRTVPANAKSGAYVLIASDAGKYISITTGGVTLNTGIFSTGQNVTIYNDSASSQTITQGSGVTMYLVGSATTGNRTLSQRGLCTILCVGTNTFVITGGGVS